MQKSFRRTPDAALIRAGDDSAVIRGGFSDVSGGFDIAVEIPSAGRRQVLVNGKRPARLSDVATTAPVVAFLPDDLDLVKRGPTLRREYLDDLGAQLVPTVGADQREFEKALRQRNTLLRQDGRNADPMTLDVWDVRVAESGGRVIANRLRLLGRLCDRLTDAYRTVGGTPAETLLPVYGSSWASVDGDHSRGWIPTSKHMLLRCWGRWRSAETVTWRCGARVRDRIGTTRATGWTDATYVCKPARGSSGRLRSAFALLPTSLLDQRHGRPPILLLDDVFSELDPGAGRRVSLPCCRAGQVFVTSARDDEVPRNGEAVAGRRRRVDMTGAETHDRSHGPARIRDRGLNPTRTSALEASVLERVTEGKLASDSR